MLGAYTANMAVATTNLRIRQTDAFSRKEIQQIFFVSLKKSNRPALYYFQL